MAPDEHVLSAIAFLTAFETAVDEDDGERIVVDLVLGDRTDPLEAFDQLLSTALGMALIIHSLGPALAESMGRDWSDMLSELARAAHTGEPVDWFA